MVSLSRRPKELRKAGSSRPLLANIVLNHLDWQLHANRFKFVRYADDFVITCKTLSQTEKALDLVKNILSQDLDLQLSPEKTKITRLYDGFQFLGFYISDRTTRMRPQIGREIQNEDPDADETIP